MQEIILTRPDDWHLHLRDGEALKAVLPHTVRQFARVIVMPNLKPPIRTLADATAYRDLFYDKQWSGIISQSSEVRSLFFTNA